MAGDKNVVVIQLHAIYESLDCDVMMCPLRGHGIEVIIMLDQSLLCGISAASDASIILVLWQWQKEFAFFFEQLATRFTLVFNHYIQPISALPQKQFIQLVNIDNMRRRRY